MPDINSIGDAQRGYVSDAELMAWLETKAGHQYDDLRDQMNVSTQRQELVQALNNLKTQIDGAGTTDSIDKLKQDITELTQAYKGTPFEQELDKLFLGTDELGERHGAFFELTGDIARDGALLGSLKERIGSEADKLGKIDSLALVQIQSLVSDAKETAQLASNVLSSRDQTRGGIIGNIRA